MIELVQLQLIGLLLLMFGMGINITGVFINDQETVVKCYGYGVLFMVSGVLLFYIGSTL